MKLIKLAPALGAVVLAFAVIIPTMENSAEARNAPSVTETVEVEFTTVEGGFVTTVRVSASRQKGPDSDGEVVVRHSVTICTSLPLLLHSCYIHIHRIGLNTALEFSLKDASLIVLEQKSGVCGLFCPSRLDRPIIKLELEGIGGVEVTMEGNTKTKNRRAKVTGIVDGVPVPDNVYGTITVTNTRN